jgi:hypothetical protein
MNTDKNSLRSGLAWASYGGDIVVPEKGRLSGAGCACWMPGQALVSAGQPALVSAFFLAGARWLRADRMLGEALAVAGQLAGEAPAAAAWPDEPWRSQVESVAVWLIVDLLLLCSLNASVVVTDPSWVRVTLWLTVSQSVSLGVELRTSDPSMSGVSIFILSSLCSMLANGRLSCHGERWLGRACFTVGGSHKAHWVYISIWEL